MEWNDPKINWYLTKPFFYHSSNNNPILSEMDQRFLHRKKKIWLDHKDTFRNDIILRVTIRYYPRAKLKSLNHTIRHNSFTTKKRHKDYFFKVTKLFLVETTWILPLETELKPDTRQTLFHQRIRLTKTRYTLLPFLIPTSYLYTSASSCFYPWPQIRQTQENNARRSGALPPDPPGIAFITFLPGTRLCRRLLRITTTLSSRLIRHPRVREFTARIVNAQRGSMDSIRVLYLLHKCLKSLRGLLVLIIIRSMVYKESI